MKKLSKFKQFNESNDSIEISKQDIEEIFIEFIDNGYLFTMYGDGRLDRIYPGTFYFDFRKQFSKNFDFEDSSLSYGCKDLDSMQSEIEKVFEILKDCKHKLNSMGYKIGFEPEFTFSEDTLFCITCHMSHSDTKDDDED